MRKFTFLTMVIVLILLFSIIYCFAENNNENIEYSSEKAKIINIKNTKDEEFSMFDGETQEITIEIISGKLKGKEFKVENILSDNEAYNLRFKKNDIILISIETDINTGDYEIMITDHYRVKNLVILLFVFIILILIIGKLQGLRAIISLGLTLILVIYILLPGILKGYNPIILSILVSIIITIVTIILITGVTKKSFSAILGTSIGVLIAGIIAYVLGKGTNLTGLSAEDATLLMFIPQNINFNFQHLLFAGIILGSLGAVMDIGMSIASAIDEIYLANEKLSRKELFNSGMNVGKDIMGTMVNTLILAYTGSSIPMLLLFMAYDATAIDILNLDMVSTEVIRSISGSIGLILTIPITAIISSFLIKKTDNKKTP